jgi:glycogen operon protein
MSVYDWNSAENRTLQYMAASTPEHEEFNRILLVIHGIEAPVAVTLPVHLGVASYTELWDSGNDAPNPEEGPTYEPGTVIEMAPSSLRLFRAN